MLSAALLCFGQISPAFALSSASNYPNQIKEIGSGATASAENATYGDFEVTGDASTIAFKSSTGVLTISGGEHTISMASGSTETSTSQRIEVTGAATITLAGVYIRPNQGAPITITRNAAFDVNILLADDSGNMLDAPAQAAGLQKLGTATSVGKLTIGVPANSIGNGMLGAIGGQTGAGIGGVMDQDFNVDGARNINIEGGTVFARGGYNAAGIGGGQGTNGTDITISGGTVMAQGGYSTSADHPGGAGIGGGERGSGSNIKITGGIVTASGGTSSNSSILAASAIGSGGYSPSDPAPASSGNVLNGDAVVKATSGGTGVDALTGFDATTGLVKGIAYTRQGLSGTWSSTIYGNEIAIKEDTDFPANLTIGNGTTIKNEANLTFASGAVLTCTGTGKIETLLTYNPQGGSFDDISDTYQLYQDASGTGKKYQNLPQPVANATFGGWFTQPAGQGQAITGTTDVLLNTHQVYADMAYTVSFNSQGGSAVAPLTDVVYNAKVTEPAVAPTRAGYTFDGWYKEAACTNKWNFASDTVQGDIILYAGWILDGPTPPDPGPGPEPTPAPTPEPAPATDGSDILPVTGDTTQSVGLFAVAAAGLGIVLALLGGVYALAQKRDA